MVFIGYNINVSYKLYLIMKKILKTLITTSVISLACSTFAFAETNTTAGTNPVKPVKKEETKTMPIKSNKKVEMIKVKAEAKAEIKDAKAKLEEAKKEAKDVKKAVVAKKVEETKKTIEAAKAKVESVRKTEVAKKLETKTVTKPIQ